MDADADSSEAMAVLKAAARDWVEQAKTGPLSKWLDRELDPDSVPRRLDVTHWFESHSILRSAVEQRPEGWPERYDALIEGWFRALLRFARPNGSSVYGPEPTRPEAGVFRFWAERLTDPGLSTVVDWWFPRGTSSRHAPPPLPADARPDRPLAVLRANWAKDGDILAIDHRVAGSATRLELIGAGVRWLGSGWESPPLGDPAGKARPTLWVSQSSADAAEWKFRVGRATVTRAAVLLRGRRLALLSEQWDGPGDPGAFRLGLAEGVQATRPTPGSRVLSLSQARGRVSARVLPIGLPPTDYPTERGSLEAEGREIVLRMPALESERRVWRALLVSWEPRRNRQAVLWRNLTVSQSSKVCGRDVAVGARVSWGRNDSLLIYRSLAPPALRAVLGHQTCARFLIGLFTREGEVEPLLKVEN
jgi:hypothetical protein